MRIDGVVPNVDWSKSGLETRLSNVFPGARTMSPMRRGHSTLDHLMIIARSRMSASEIA